MVAEIYTNTKNFPKEEIFGITSQIRRAAVSVVLNIAEGASRQHKKDYLNFLFIARGSLAETEYLIKLSKELGYFKEKDFNKAVELKEATAKTLFGLIKAVKKEV